MRGSRSRGRRVRFERREQRRTGRLKRKIDVEDEPDEEETRLSVEDAEDNGVGNDDGENDEDGGKGSDAEVEVEIEAKEEDDAEENSDIAVADVSGSEGSEEDGGDKSSASRLTSRQRAMRDGGNRKAFDAPQESDQEEPEERMAVDEAKELKRQQQARLRRISHEKRKEEKRAATIEKVLRGVTGKRKRQSQEAEQAAVEREQKHQVKSDCVRYAMLRGKLGLGVRVRR